MINNNYLKWNLILVKVISFLMALLFILFIQRSYALPEGGVVAAGEATININNELENQLEINQQTSKAIIDWQNFNIKPYEQAIFNQPDHTSVTLNRIHSSTASEIDGQLKANGKIILINQNGILFGKEAKVDVNGLLATTADINNEQFQKDFTNYNDQGSEANQNNTDHLLIFDKFGNPESKIINEGDIIANEGLVGLIAPNVINRGLIIAKAGKVHLASGEKFTLDFYGDNLINIEVQEKLSFQLVSNEGRIIADGNKILLTTAASQDIVNGLILNSGALQARSVAAQNGEIIISAEGSNAVPNNASELKGSKSGQSKVVITGVIDASGLQEEESGGKIKILGDHINLLGEAVIDASGCNGKFNTTLDLEPSAVRVGAAGGEILVGGDYLGKNNIPTALSVIVAPSVKVSSDSLETGDAGRIIFWSDGVTNFGGKVYARAIGEVLDNNNGNGGFVEISGHKNLILSDKYNVILSSARGLLGTLFLDPTTLTIDSNFILTNNIANISVAADDIIFDLGSNTFNIGDDFNFSITANSSLSVNTGGSIITNRTTSNGNIFIDTSLAVGAAVDFSNLEFNAQNGGKIIINTAGTTTLGNLHSGSLLVQAIGVASDLIIPANKKITVTEAINPLILVAGGNFKNQNTTSGIFNFTNNAARWLIYSTNIDHDQGVNSDLIGSYGTLYGKYDINSLPTDLGNLLTYTGVKLVGYYLNKNTTPDDTHTNKKITINNLRLTGPAAGNYTLNNKFTASGYIGTIVPRRIKPSLASTKIVKTYDGTTVASNLTFKDNYQLSNTIVSDLGSLSLTNYATGVYSHRQADSTDTYQTVSVSGLGLTGSEAVNYALTTNNVASDVGHINRRTIVAAFDLTKVVKKTYDGNNIANLADNNYVILTNVVTVNGVKDDVNLQPVTTGTYNHITADAFGVYQPVTVTGLSLNPQGVDVGNYTLASSEIVTANNVGHIDQRSIAISLVGPIIKIYDGYNNVTSTLLYTPTPDAQNKTNFVISNMVPADLNNITLHYTDAIYNNKNAATNKNVVVSGISLSGGNASSYITPTTALASIGTITPKILTVNLIPPISKTYDGNTAAVVSSKYYSLSGVVDDGVIKDTVNLMQNN